MKKNLSLVLLFSLCYQLKSQNNIIPNGNFEFSSPPVCVSSIISFNTNVSNWKVAEHSNGEGVGTPEWLNFLTCSYNAYCDGIGVFVNSNRFIAIKADIRKCKKIGSGFNIKRFHEAVVVGLDGGASFTQYAYYTIRYKIIPIRASLIEGDEFESTCVSLQTDCHLRVFLSKKGTKHWNDVGGNVQQEVVNANYVINSGSNPSCNWIAVERTFVVNYSGMKNLVLYAESGGFIIAGRQFSASKSASSPSAKTGCEKTKMKSLRIA